MQVSLAWNPETLLLVLKRERPPPDFLCAEPIEQSIWVLDFKVHSQDHIYLGDKVLKAPQGGVAGISMLFCPRMVQLV